MVCLCGEETGIRGRVRSSGLGNMYKRKVCVCVRSVCVVRASCACSVCGLRAVSARSACGVRCGVWVGCVVCVRAAGGAFLGGVVVVPVS